MSRRSFVAELEILLAKVTVTYLFVQLKVLGLVPYSVDPKRRTASKSNPKLLYSISMAVSGIGFYFYSGYKSQENPNLKYFFSGVSLYTGIMTDLLAFGLVGFVYGVQLWNRRPAIAYLNRLQVDHEHFQSLFYDGYLAFNRQEQYNDRHMEQIRHVYLPLAGKVVFLNTIISLLIVAQTYLISVKFDAHFGITLYQLIYAYVIQSVASSYLHLGAAKVNYMYRSVNKKVFKIDATLREIIRDSSVSAITKTGHFCRISDEVEELAGAIDKVFNMANDLSALYRVHMVVIFGYSVLNSLRQLFLQYTDISNHVKGGCEYDTWYATITLSITVLGIVELLLIVTSIENSIRQCKRVAKSVHRILYAQLSFDIRLKQSLEMLSFQMSHTIVNFSLYKMRPMNFALILGTTDTIITFLVILIQFDLANPIIAKLGC